MGRRFSMGTGMEGDHERAIVRAFFVPERRARYLSLLSTARGRKRFVSGLAHFDALDLRHMQLRDALRDTVGFGVGTFISCIVGQLAYFEGEEPGSRYICERGILER